MHYLKLISITASPLALRERPWHSGRCRCAGVLESVDHRTGLRLSAAHAPGPGAASRILWNLKPAIARVHLFPRRLRASVRIWNRRRCGTGRSRRACSSAKPVLRARTVPGRRGRTLHGRWCGHFGSDRTGASEQRLGRRAGRRSTGVGCRSPGRRGRANHDHRSHSPIPSSRWRRGFRTACEFSVGDGALLEYLPDAVIPYAGSRHMQRTEIRLGRGSTLFWWEILAPGRLAAGERFAFERLRVQTEVYAGHGRS